MTPEVPRRIYSLWLQGLDKAPDLVRFNLARWESLNPGYHLRVFDAATVRARLGGQGLPIAGMTPQALSDILRTHLLLETGGIWVDASLFPVRPLDEWLGDAMTDAGFFAFERPGPDRPLSSWFLAASAGHPILRAWWLQTKRYWSRSRSLEDGTPDDPAGRVSPEGAMDDAYPYFWFHYLFAYLLRTETEIDAAWERCVKLSAGPPHELQALFVNDAKPASETVRRVAALAPVQKLNWRISYPLDVLASI